MEQAKVNEHLVKISTAQIPIDNPLMLGQDINLFIKGNITKTAEQDNQDGTINKIYYLKGIVSELIPEDMP